MKKLAPLAALAVTLAVAPRAARAQSTFWDNGDPQQLMITTFAAQYDRAGDQRDGKGAFGVPGIFFDMDWGAASQDDRYRKLAYHSELAVGGGWGGAGKTAYDLWISAGLSYAVNSQIAFGVLYEPLGIYSNPIQGFAGSGIDLKLRVWRAQFESYHRGVGYLFGFMNGTIKQSHVGVKLVLIPGLVAGMEHWGPPRGAPAGVNRFTLGFEPFSLIQYREDKDRAKRGRR